MRNQFDLLMQVVWFLRPKRDPGTDVRVRGLRLYQDHTFVVCFFDMHRFTSGFKFSARLLNIGGESAEIYGFVIQPGIRGHKQVVRTVSGDE